MHFQVSKTRRGVLGAAWGAAAWAAFPSAARAAATTRIIVGFAAGGGIDQLARLLAERLPPLLGSDQSVIVENRPGAAGKIAVDALLNAPGDGTTLLLAPLITPVLSQLVFNKPGYEPGRDFAPIALVAHFQFVLAVPVAHPARTVPQLLAWLKANPAKANFGSPSPGSLPHFFGLLLGDSVGVDMVHVGYKGGSSMLVDLAGGQIPIGIDTEAELLPMHKAGKIRILGTFSSRRLPALPDTPTFVELGYPRANGSAWYSLWARKSVPVATQRLLNESVRAMQAQPEVQNKFGEWGLQADPRSPEALEQFRLAEIEKWRGVIVASGFKAD